MARIQCSGGIVLEGPERVWLVDDPGDEVHDWRRHKAAPVVIGPPDAAAEALAAARTEAALLVLVGGPLAAAAGVDLGHGFRSARLDGGGESRRDAVLAAVGVLGRDGMERIGDRAAVLVALFGMRATRRVGAAAMEALARDETSSVRLAVAASDLLGPEQLEDVLGWSATLPPGVSPVPRADVALLAEHLASVMAPFTARRRLTLLRSAWDGVVAWHRSAEAQARARRRSFSRKRYAAWQRQVARADDRWWSGQAEPILGSRPTRAAMLSWRPPYRVMGRTLFRAFQEGVSATVLLRTALASEQVGAEAAVTDTFDQLMVAVTAHIAKPGDPIEAARRYEPRGWIATDRAAELAKAAIGLADPDGPDRRALLASLRSLLREACELAQAALESAHRAYAAVEETSYDFEPVPAMAEWRRAAGYSAVRPPQMWPHRAGIAPDERPLAARLVGDAADPAAVERIDDGLWLADLGDVIANWYGHEQALIEWPGIETLTVDPPVEPRDPSLPRLESIPLALAGAAQLLSIGATPPARPKSWDDLAAGLVTSAEALGFTDDFEVSRGVGVWHGKELVGTGLQFEVARNARQLTAWGAYMGNCIGTYAEDAQEGFVLVALRDADGQMVANVCVYRTGNRWHLQQARARFNGDLPDPLHVAIVDWVRGLHPPAKAASVRTTPGPPPGRPGRAPRGRRAPVRDRRRRDAAELGEVIGDLRTSADLVAAEAALRSVAVGLGWTGEDEDWLSLFVAIARPRRSGGPLAGAVGDALGQDLAQLWAATEFRPLSAALAGGDGELARLAEATVPPSLRLALKEPRVWDARVVELAARKVRAALGELLRNGDERLDVTVAARPHLGFVTAGVLAVTAEQPSDGRALTAVPVGEDGTVPGRPVSSVADQDGVWRAAVTAAVELGAGAEEVARVLDAAPGGRLLVPTAWLPARGWGAFWTRAYRADSRR